ncbi:tyrosine-type recombinase/integrase [Bradyrhizobium diazoefficiens]|nr:site-specific integrase [Bradyrhizobium diazoefficiens]MBR0777292.1 tyrosine-type recombinase/integrase [Bradyrhizobium diazoefficiens]
MNAMNHDFAATGALNTLLRGRFYHYDIMVDGVRWRGSTKCTVFAEALIVTQRIKDRLLREAAARREAGPPVDATFDAIADACWKSIKCALRTSGERPSMRARRREFLRVVLAFGPQTMGSQLDYHAFVEVRDRLLTEPAPARKRGRPRKSGGKGMTPKSVGNLMKTAMRILAFGATRMGLSLPNRPLPPYTDLLPVVTPRSRYLREGSEQQRLLALLDPDLAEIVLFALETGLRWNELAGLTWDDVDMVEESIRVYLKGRGHDEVPHTVFLSETALQILDRRRAGAQSQHVFTTKAEGDCRFDDIFYAKGSQVPYTYNRMHRSLSAALRQAGIEDFGFHDLRRTAARRLWLDSNIEVAAAFLGHKDTSTTLKYLGLTPSDVHAAQRQRALQQARRQAEIRKAIDEGRPVPELEDKRIVRIREQFLLEEKLAQARKARRAMERRRPPGKGSALDV